MLTPKAQKLIEEAKARQPKLKPITVNPQTLHEPSKADFGRGQRASIAGIKRAPKFDRAFMRTLGKNTAKNIGRLKKWFEGFDNAQVQVKESFDEIFRDKVMEKYGIDVGLHESTDKKPLVLYHGTSAHHLEHVEKHGLKDPYLTSNKRIADYYAEDASDETNSDPKVLKVTVHDTSKLTADHPSYNEPLTHVFRDVHGFKSEDDWHQAIKSKKIKYPKQSDWQSSLKTVHSVRHIGHIEPHHIEVEGDSNE